MFTVEQGNRVAMNAMGQSQYMSAIRQQSRGFIHAGEDTDQPPVTSSTARSAAEPPTWSGVTYAEGYQLLPPGEKSAQHQFLLL